ncbi:tyrosine-protein phosphatase non-receptor type substrate 1-like [Parambassis ranga]|uniref:Tyrosine-protein phosphatase non-receptor type substrate 1-like n=1 Tax=Parambassis ranga TaxID=210632 RepID=A0A6P7JYA8_9TELE|nr:tyrosine-protein phosphatase non-receptor type substrate 1-like [Parambassis ranga]
MDDWPRLCLFLLLASGVPALTATPEGLRVRQYPRSLSVMRGETATLSCHFKVESLKYGVQWFKMKSEKQLIPKSSRESVVEKNQTSSLVIAEVALEDSGWYYCEVNVLQKDPGRGNGTELVVLAPPSAPKLYLQIPPEPLSGQWALLCLTGGFHPSRLTITWTYQSEAVDIDHLSLNNCTLPVDNPHGNLSERPADRFLLSSDWSVSSRPPQQSKCFQVMDNHSREVYLFSVLFLPKKQSLKAGLSFTCTVQDHPAMTTPLTASFIWDASPNELIVILNILKMCMLSAMTTVFLLEAVEHFCVKGKKMMSAMKNNMR